MQDIGGLRAVVREVDYVYKLRDLLLKGRFLHKLVREDDYIRKPKASGYRSLHLVYRYANKYAPEYTGLQIEIQLRTELQHIWATAVETMGIILKQSLKSDE
jgi:ppGpp synthetase/RelA/SpoT-type nucleotidyltranferase